MKKLLLVPMVVLMLTCLFALPVYADDPPDMDVDVNVSTPGDVDLDVGINAGGDVNVTVDGVDLQETANTAHQALAATGATGQGSINTADWWRYKRLYLDPLFQDLFTNDNYTHEQVVIVTQAVAKLIHEKDELWVSVNGTDKRMETYLTLIKDNSGNIDDLLVEDDAIWDQLINGAEHHLSLLEDKQAADVARLQSEIDHVRTLHTYYFGGAGFCIMILLVSVVLLARKLSRYE